MPAHCQPPRFEAEWARCAPWLDAALARDGGFFALEDVAAAIGRGEAQFWPGKRSAIVTQFWTFPRARALHFWLAGGDLSEITDQMQPVIEAWARDQGCQRSIIAGRRGWLKALPDYRPLWTAMSKDL